MQYRERLASIPGLTPLGDAEMTDRHAWHLFIVRVDPDAAGIDRSTFMAALKADNIGTGIHFRAVHTQKWFVDHPDRWRGADLVNTEWNSDRICSLPLFPGMTDEDVDEVVASIRNAVPSIRGVPA
jgi:UDP-4-amino-4-deoxy-L-arabinose-oxoglutarate aminotransferase